MAVVMTPEGPMPALMATSNKPRENMVCSIACEQMIERGRALWAAVNLKLCYPTRELIESMDEPEHTIAVEQIERGGRLPWVRMN